MSLVPLKRKRSDFDLTALELGDVPPAIVAGAARDLADYHHLAGYTRTDGNGAAVIAFQLDHGARVDPVPTRPRFRLETFKESVLGYGLGIVARDGKTVISHARLSYYETGVRELLEKRVATMLLFRGETLVAAYAAVWAGTEAQLDDAKLAHRLMRDEPELPLAGHFSKLDRTFEAGLLTIEDRADAGWFQALDGYAQLMGALFASRRSEILEAAARTPDMPEPLVHAVAVLRASANPMPRFAAIAAGEWSAHGLRRLIRPPLGEPLNIVLQGLLTMAINSDTATRNGTALPCYGYVSDPRLVPLDLAAIERRGGPRPFLTYWTRVICSVRFLWATFLTGTEMPASLPEVAAAFPDTALVVDPEVAQAMAETLIREAVRDRYGTIPYGAKVELRVGPFTHALVYPLPNVVLVQCWTTAEEFVVLCAWLDAAIVSALVHSLPTTENVVYLERVARMNATLTVMLAAIIRDFSVTEHRERVFATRTEPAPPSRSGSRSDMAPAVVYLPRVRYARAPDVERGVRELGLIERRIHDVTPHLRRSSHASAEQLALAAIHGLSVPDGFTFVRAHRRGTKEAEVVYRSRSAMQAIFEPLEAEEVPAASGWFRFEAAVRAHLEASGLTIERSTPLVHGIEILAVPERGDGLCLVHALDLDRVGRAHVDTLDRRRAEAPAHVQVRAVLLTRGEASPSVRARAVELGIDVADGIDRSAPC